MKEENKTMIQNELYLMNKDKGMLDSLQEKVVSRKLLVFLTATALMMYANLDPDIWGMIAVCYIGGQSAIDFAKSWKHGGYDVKLTKQQLKQIIKEELDAVLGETQVALGLPHTFSNYELAERILTAIDNDEQQEILEELRAIALHRSEKLTRDLGELTPGDSDQMNKIQELEFLELALEKLDIHLEDFVSRVIVSPDYGVPTNPKGNPLRRPYSKIQSKLKKDTHRRMASE